MAKRMYKKRRLVKGKIYKKRKFSKKLLLAKRWKKLVISPRGIEVKQTMQSVSHAFANQIAGSNNALPVNMLLNIVPWPSVGTSDSQRIGDTINVKNFSFQMMFKIKPVVNQCYIRIVIYTSPYYDPAVAYTGFWKFGAQTNYPALLCSVDREAYSVLYDKIININALAVNNSLVSGQLGQGVALVRGSIPFNRKVEFIGGGVLPKDTKRDHLYISLHGTNQNGTDNQAVCDAIMTFKLNYSD